MLDARSTVNEKSRIFLLVITLMHESIYHGFCCYERFALTGCGLGYAQFGRNASLGPAERTTQKVI